MTGPEIDYGPSTQSAAVIATAPALVDIRIPVLAPRRDLEDELVAEAAAIHLMDWSGAHTDRPARHL